MNCAKFVEVLVLRVTNSSLPQQWLVNNLYHDIETTVSSNSGNFLSMNPNTGTFLSNFGYMLV